MIDGVIWITLHRYLLYLETLPETRRNIPLQESVRELIDHKPDTEESLNGTTH